ncbi:hypothetical protein OCU04_000326 [Sclerotinia nivalis]|uniref:Uncharacterized protein n=1 Tax=Sclerotinia nivalis TaxID=352851 RepID=A0A9X0DR67_9HELO|nr:hypothetical protein OCU04_000326 [Sclerotinia nivalis]
MLSFIEAYGSQAFSILASALKFSSRVEIGYITSPAYCLPCGKVLMSNRITIPKLLLPPLSAVHRSEFALALALMIRSSARTTSKLSTISQHIPNLGEEEENPPVICISIWAS